MIPTRVVVSGEARAVQRGTDATILSSPSPRLRHYRRHPAISLTLRRRQAGQPRAAIDATWRAQLRHSQRWAHLDARRGKKRTTVAVARELS